MSKDFVTVSTHRRAFPKRKFADGGTTAAGRDDTDPGPMEMPYYGKGLETMETLPDRGDRPGMELLPNPPIKEATPSPKVQPEIPAPSPENTLPTTPAVKPKPTVAAKPASSSHDTSAWLRALSGAALGGGMGVGALSGAALGLLLPLIWKNKRHAMDEKPMPDEKAAKGGPIGANMAGKRTMKFQAGGINPIANPGISALRRNPAAGRGMRFQGADSGGGDPNADMRLSDPNIMALPPDLRQKALSREDTLTPTMSTAPGLRGTSVEMARLFGVDPATGMQLPGAGGPRPTGNALSLLGGGGGLAGPPPGAMAGPPPGMSLGAGPGGAPSSMAGLTGGGGNANMLAAAQSNPAAMLAALGQQQGRMGPPMGAGGPPPGGGFALGAGPGGPPPGAMGAMGALAGAGGPPPGAMGAMGAPPPGGMGAMGAVPPGLMGPPSGAPGPMPGAGQSLPPGMVAALLQRMQGGGAGAGGPQFQAMGYTPPGGLPPATPVGAAEGGPVPYKKGGKVFGTDSADGLPPAPPKKGKAAFTRKPKGPAISIAIASKKPAPAPSPYDYEDSAPHPVAPPMAKGGAVTAKAKGGEVAAKAKGGEIKKAKGGECDDKMAAGGEVKKAKGGTIKKAKGGVTKLAAGGAAKQRRGFPNTSPPKRLAAGGKVRGCGAAVKGCTFSGCF